MSLKAKIEAVIYAAEEPVTLAQFAFLFGGEVPRASEQPAIPESANRGTENVSQESAEGTDAPFPAQSNSLPESTDSASHSEEPEPGSSDSPAEDPDGKKSARARDRAVREELKAIIAGLIEEYSTGDRGMEIREIAGGYRVTTKPEYHDAVRSFVKSLKPPMKLTLQALETLAVIAYKQPVTAPEVNEIRGVDSGGVLGSLMSRKLITTAGRKQVIGRPILYKTTKEFLLRFGLKDVNELPSIEEFEKMAGEMEIEDDAEPTRASGELPFDGEAIEGVELEPNNAAIDPIESAAVEANAGEAGVSVGTPAETEAEAATPQPETVELDSRMAAETAPAEHGAELITAVHPTTTLGGE
ncbi:MAG TPA: SMC-Scp complex subunit ScpB [Acidisarcina sp.]